MLFRSRGSESPLTVTHAPKLFLILFHWEKGALVNCVPLGIVCVWCVHVCVLEREREKQSVWMWARQKNIQINVTTSKPFVAKATGLGD